MKKFRIVLAVAAAVLLALPPVFGLVTESQVRARVESMNSDGALAATIESYDRGWFTSSAHIALAPPARLRSAAAPDAEAEPDLLALLFDAPLDVIVDISHGPVSLRDGVFVGASEFVARPAQAAAAASADDTGLARREPFRFEFHGQSTFAGEVHFLAVLPPLDRANSVGAISFSGGRLSGTFAGRRVTGRGEADTLQWTQGPATLSMQGISASVDSEFLSRYVVPGNLELGVERASVDWGSGDFGSAASTGGSGPVFDASGFVLRTEVRHDAVANRLGSNASVSLDSARFGADTRVTDGRLDVTVSDLDAAALEAASRTVEQAGGAPPQLEELAPYLERVLAAGPTLSINPLRFDVNGAPFDATLWAQAAAPAVPASGPIDLRSPELWGDILSGTAELTAEKRLVERLAAAAVKAQLAAQFVEGSAVPFEALDTMAEAQANLVLAMLSAQGILEDTGNVYRTELRLEDGALIVNGRPLPLDIL